MVNYSNYGDDNQRPADQSQAELKTGEPLKAVERVKRIWVAEGSV